MDDMLGENKNLKDPISGKSIALRDSFVQPITYTKTNKLITALFMVTDIMDREEPMRNKLRFLGTGIISDMYINPADSEKKVSEILVLLDISKEVQMVSEMNYRILKREFEELLKSIRSAYQKKGPIWIEDLLSDEPSPEENPGINKVMSFSSIGQTQPTRIGVQKGSTLLKALRSVSVSDRTCVVSSEKGNHSSVSVSNQGNQAYEALKTKRREEIVSIIKNKLSILPESGGATITDIKNSAEGPLVSCGEKTLQRELVSMVHDGVLKKSGEKRWSKYFL